MGTFKEVTRDLPTIEAVSVEKSEPNEVYLRQYSLSFS